jgi:type IV pilus assembly protein PilN
MNDLNFFSIYQNSIKERKDDKIYIYIFWVVVGACIIFSFLFCMTRILMLNGEINDYSQKLNSEEVKSKYAEAEEINNKLDILSKYDDSLCSVSSNIKLIDIINDDLLVNISDSVPSDLSFTEWDTSGYELKIKGASSTRASVAEFQHNLKQYSQFKIVHVDKIEAGEYVGDDYEFEMTCVLKEGE